ncbi:MAG: ATPase, T2SS/T4P/T4SS family [bacterium]|nr:ATPase, T2SS/T4P/T4SS family [bacterium]
MAKDILDILIAKGTLKADEAAEIKENAAGRDLAVEDVLYERHISETDVATAKSEAIGYPFKSLRKLTVPYEVLKEIPEESARYYKMVPVAKEEGYLDVGMLNPDDVAAREALKFTATKVNLPVRIFVVTPSDLQGVINQYKVLAGEVTKALGEFEKEVGLASAKPEAKKVQDLTAEGPVTKMVSVILRHAVEGKASDIHIEPMRDGLRVRFRLDGILHTSLNLPLETHAAIISRIKVMTNLKIDENRVPQDGRFHAEVSGRDIDFRVSTFPASMGEKIVIRILDSEAGVKNLEDLGVDGRNLDTLKEGMKRPYGMILITGPTGSGKSTTIYAMLQILNQEKTNIVSLEDPIEYYMTGINQSQIHPEIGYDFANGLRSILRQDPDIIMVGEIRDKETAGLAIHAALTGHLVLSTLHTNTAIGVIPRLIDMGVDPYLIAPSLIMAVGQRLARKLCSESRKKVKLEGRVKDMINEEIVKMPDATQKNLKIPDEIYQAQIGSECPKGTRGRMGIFEVLMMTPELEKIILSEPSDAKISEEAKRQGMITMKQDGVMKVLAGKIGLEELLEVV